MKINDFCYDCGCKGTISYKNVKNILTANWKWYTNITNIYDFHLNHCEVCGNFVLNTKEIPKMDELLLKSLAVKFLCNIIVEDRDGKPVIEIINKEDIVSFKFNERNKSDCYTFYSLLHNANVDTTPYIKIAQEILSQRDYSIEDFAKDFNKKIV